MPEILGSDETKPFAGKGQLSFSALQALAEESRETGNKDLARKISAQARDIKAAAEKEAVGILSGEASTPERMLTLAKQLAGYKQLGYARRLLDRALKDSNLTANPTIYPQVFQKSAVFTYKDPDLPIAWRLDSALRILQESKGAENLLTTRDPETLGIAGAIYKRKWEVDGQRHNLERSLQYYLKGYAQGAPPEGREDILGYLRRTSRPTLDADEDKGYTGINAAFILDLLAQKEEEEAKQAKLLPQTSNQKREDARRIRKEIIRSVPRLCQNPALVWLKDEWWWYATIGEAFFGLGRYRLAVDWLVKKPSAAGLHVPEWEYESTAQQLTRLALLKHDPNISEEQFERTASGKALKDFLKGSAKKVRSAFRGKFGLALSGGGFRASLYHIGALARLAELDVLRHVEVLSCVSGGSIVGAYYYLELRKLLQGKHDDAITPTDYVKIVERIEEQFLKGVQRNIRTRVLAEFTTNLKMVFWPGYSRTRRVGELYERELYSRIDDGGFEGPRWLPHPLAKLFGYQRERYLNDLFVHPFISETEREEDFRPRDHNWKRTNKVPNLILNATSLNTGHVWQFTASYMGEPPDPTNSKVDSNYRLRRMYYRNAPERYKQFRLGYAVAASSGVPALFDPLILDGLYPDDNAGLKTVSVRLVDGGVYDNQGIASLLEQDCTFLLVSDASGQMESDSVPNARAISVLWRSNNISMARVRGIQYNNAVVRKSSSLLRGLMFVHLKQELSGRAIAWKDCPDDLKVSAFERERQHENSRTSYGISAAIQQQLAAVRTDLDSFSEAEAYALMASGYRMTKRQFEEPDRSVEGFEHHHAGSWKFNGIDDSLQDQGKRRKHLEKLLRASSSVAFKVWKQLLLLIIFKWTLLFAAVSAIGWGFYHWRSARLLGTNVEWIQKRLMIGKIGIAIAMLSGLVIAEALIAAFVGKVPAKYIMYFIHWRETLKKIAIGIVMCLLGWLVARVHLHVFDKLYLWNGKLKRFPNG